MLCRLVIFVAVIFVGNCQYFNDTKKLYSDLLSDYIEDVIPIANESEPLELLIRSFLFHIKSFREVEEVITISLTLILDWTDASLKWIPWSYGGKQHINIPAEKVWTPSIYLTNSANEMGAIGRNQGINVRVSYRGDISYRPGGTIDAICPTDVSKFPFDVQTCAFSFNTRGYSASDISLQTKLDYVIGSMFTAHPDWILVDNKTFIIAESNDFNVRTYTIEFTIKRHSAYYVAIIIVPMVLFCLLNPLVFLLPVRSGDRTSLAMTMLLSYAVFFTRVSNSIPAKSNPMSYLLIVLTTVILVSGLIVGFSIISVIIDFEDSQGPLKCGHHQNTDKAKENKKKLCARQILRRLDKTFCLISYVLFTSLIITYIVLVGL